MGHVSDAPEQFAELKRQVLERVDLSREVPDEEMQDLIDEVVLFYGKEHHISLDKRCSLKKELFYALRKMDVLQELLEDENVTEIMVNGMNGIYLEEKGKLRRWEKNFYSEERILDIIQQMAGACNRTVNESQPIMDARLPNGRLNVVLPPVAVDGPIMTIRRFPKEAITMQYLLEMDSLSEEEAEFLQCAVKAGYSILIAGGTGSGKTTFLNALSEYIPEDERVVVIEDTTELQIQSVENLVRMETRSSGSEEGLEITIRDLIRASLRMRPSRIIVGEVRGAEAFELLTCLNTGHDGSISTCHANSTRDTISRFETMSMMSSLELPLEAIRRQIASGVDLIVYLGRLRDKSRRLLEITEVTGMQGGEVALNPLFLFRETGEISGKICGVQEKVGVMKNIEKFQRAGILEQI